MNIQKALERIFKKHSCDDHPNEWLLSFNKGVDGKWRLQGLSYDGEHTTVLIKITDEDFFNEEEEGFYAFHDYGRSYGLGMNVMKRYGRFELNLVGLNFLGRYPNIIFICPILKDGRNYMGLERHFL